MRNRALWFQLLAVGLVCGPATAAVLPEDRSDALYHSYNGGGVTINGPSILLRKKIGRKFSIFGNYYVDSVSSASIDVVTTASPYKEERTQYSLGANFLRGKTTMSLAFTNSEENDYEANTAAFSVSQDIFGDLTTITLSYARGWDTVGKVDEPDFMEDLDRQTYAVGISQILTKNLLMGLTYEAITDEGFLNNPYRSVRYADPGSAIGFSYEPEVYPNTRTSNAVSLRARYYMPYRAALHGEYRYFTDTWDIEAHTGEVGYTHPLDRGLILDFKYRYYTQTAADFYADLFPREQFQNFLARDKELSTFTSQTFGAKVSYDIVRRGWKFVDKGSVNLSWDHIMFDYDDFRDLTQNGPVGGEPLYSFSADVVQFFVSFWY